MNKLINNWMNGDRMNHQINQTNGWITEPLNKLLSEWTTFLKEYNRE